MIDDRREALEKAFEHHEKPDEPREEEEGRPEADTEEPIRASASEEGVEEKPEEEEKPAEEEEEKPAEEEEKPAEEKDDEEEDDDPEASGEAGKENLKAPQSWKPEVREHWSKIPKAAQEVITKRELEVSRVLNHSAGARRLATEFIDVVRPYEGLIRAQNSTPMQAVKNMMQTAARLTIGTPQQKALAAAGVLTQYGVDLELLDKILAGDPAANKEANLDDVVDRRVKAQMDPINQRLAAQDQAEQTRLREKADKEMAEFSKTADFFEDLRDEMADIYDVAVAAGRHITLQRAYDLALADHPELKKIVDARKSKATVSTAQKKAAKAKKLASSITTRSAPSGRRSEGNTRVDDLAAAWDKAAGG